MKHPLFLLKAGALIAVIFVSGVYVGRVTAPSEIKQVVVRESSTPTGNDGLDAKVRVVMNQYVKALDLTVEQQLQLYPIFGETGTRVIPLPKRSPERLAEFERLHEEMKPLLTEDQKVELDKIMEAGRAQIRKD